jgi:hypothetical protein
MPPIESDRLRKTDGRLMAKKKRRSPIGENWISYPRSMLESPALRALSLSAIRVMHRLEIEHMAHGGAENGRLIVTHDQFVEAGVHHNAIAPALRELVALGFIEITERGCAGNESHRRPHRFRLTYVNMKSREEPSHEWRKVIDMEEANRLAAEARAAKNERSVALGRRAKNKSPLPSAGSGAATVNRYRNPNFPLPPTGSTKLTPETGSTFYNLGGETKATAKAVRERNGNPRGYDEADAPTALLTPPDALPALVANLPWPPPRWVEITPEIDRKLNWIIDKSMSYRHAPIDALTALEALILSNALPNASARSDAVH